MSLLVTLHHTRPVTREEAIKNGKYTYKLERKKWARKKKRVYYIADGYTTYWVPSYA